MSSVQGTRCSLPTLCGCFFHCPERLPTLAEIESCLLLFPFPQFLPPRQTSLRGRNPAQFAAPRLQGMGRTGGHPAPSTRPWPRLSPSCPPWWALNESCPPLTQLLCSPLPPGFPLCQVSLGGHLHLPPWPRGSPPGISRNVLSVFPLPHKMLVTPLWSAP